MKTAAETPNQPTLANLANAQLHYPMWSTIIGRILFVAGIIFIALAAASDRLGGLPGIGVKQIALMLGGSILMLSSIAMHASGGRRRLAEWTILLIVTAAVIMVADFNMFNIIGLTDMPTKAFTILVIGCAIIPFTLTTAWADVEDQRFSLLQALALCKHELLRFAILAPQLLLLVLVMNQYKLENEAFARNIMWLTFAGFSLHFFLALRYRMNFFLLLCLATIMGTFGVANGAWLFGIGLALVGICHLPVRYRVRLTLLLLAGIGLVLLRVDWLPTPWSGAIWPILGSMFMFRLILYMYDLKHQTGKVNLTQTLAYFFLFPNVVFPLFPVVDFTTFRRTYYNEERVRIYQTGLDWIVRGTLHLLLYRFVNYYLLVAPEDIVNLEGMVQYVVTNFLLYLRVSGQFHLIVGILHLFGFNLPETHHLYFLASGFTDFWRRINIYWKDFMLKVFFYPVHFSLRRLGPTSKLVLATLFVFFVTWFFHAYQWFWLRGAFLFTGPDTLFWAILAAVVVVNSLYELKRGRKRSLGVRTWTWRELSGVSLRTSATFAVICVLWSLWSSPSIMDWWVRWAHIEITLHGVLAVLAVMSVVGLLAAIFHIGEVGQAKKSTVAGNRPIWLRQAFVSAIPLLFLYILGSPAVHTQLGGQVGEIVRDLTVARLSTQDAKMMERGYYEDLIGVNRFNSELWEVYMNRPRSAAPTMVELGAARRIDELIGIELVPSTRVFFYDKILTINRWGMRDKEYELAKAPDAYRIALVGSSHVMGWGVADNETFDWLLEDRLNQGTPLGPYSQYEVLNFGVQGYGPIESLIAMETKVPQFEPDLLLYFTHVHETSRSLQSLVEKVQEGVEIQQEFILDILQKAEIDASTNTAEALQRLNPYSDELIVQSYREIIEQSQHRGMLPVWLILPSLTGIDESDETDHLARLAADAGFTVWDLSDVYGDRDLESIHIAPWDWHPNAEGHRLISERLYHLLQADQETIFSNR